MLKLHNTLTRTTEDFKPLSPDEVRMYSCGPTVYHFFHLGNLRSSVFADTLKRSLIYQNHKVIHAMNITDVGHLVGDGDDGEDKMEAGAKREGLHPLDIAKKYEGYFFDDLKQLNILPADFIARATETIPEQIELIQKLEEKGLTYKDNLAVYFDTSKFENYGALAGQNLDEKKIGARDEVVVDVQKRNPQDFVLWFFLAGRYKDHILQWDSPWGKGFPGWHIECSAISRKLLGQPFDIHTGGVDLIGTHHTNEIAQSEAAFDVPLAHYWMHGEFLLVDGKKMSKSIGNLYTLKDISAKGLRPIDYRYLCHTAHYRTQLNFTWEALQAAHNALSRLYDFVRTAGEPSVGSPEYGARFLEAIENDLNIPKALAVVWELIGDKELSSSAKLASLLKFDKVLGLGLDNPPQEEAIPEEVQKLINERELARTNKDFAASDEIRKKIHDLGYEVMDTKDGAKAKKL